MMPPEHADVPALGYTAVDSATDARPDVHLVRELIQGSAEALAVLYDRHASAVYGSSMRISRDAWLAAEVVQETFLALWNRAESFDASRGSLTSWMLTIARNRTVDHLRSARRHERAASFSSFADGWAGDRSAAEWLAASGELIGSAHAEPAPEVALATRESRESIARAVASLDPTEGRVIELAYGEGLSQSEIATRLGWPLGTVKTRTRRALRHLRDCLDGPETSALVPDSRSDEITRDPAGAGPGLDAIAGRPRCTPACC